MKISLLYAKLIPATGQFGHKMGPVVFVESEPRGYGKYGKRIFFNVRGNRSELEYCGRLENGYELWSYDVWREGSRYVDMKFSIECETKNGVYWDNNGGWDYHLDDNHYFAMGANQVFLYQETVRAMGTRIGPAPGKGYNQLFDWKANSFVGRIAVRFNSTDRKSLRVIFTEDNWHSVREESASLSNKDDYGIEWWDFMATIRGDSEWVDFAVACSIDGRTVWDNNFGKNYRTKIVK